MGKSKSLNIEYVSQKHKNNQMGCPFKQSNQPGDPKTSNMEMLTLESWPQTLVGEIFCRWKTGLQVTSDTMSLIVLSNWIYHLNCILWYAIKPGNLSNRCSGTDSAAYCRSCKLKGFSDGSNSKMMKLRVIESHSELTLFHFGLHPRQSASDFSK